MLAPRLRGAGRLAVLLLGAAALQWDLGCIAFLSPAPRQPALRTALRSVEVEADAETDVSDFDTLTVGPETSKAKLAGAIRKQLDRRDEVTVRYAGRKGMHIAVNAVARANQYFTSSRQEAGETPFCRLIVSPKYETTASKQDPDQKFVVMDLTVRELKGPLTSKLHAEEQGGDSTLDAFRVSSRTEVRKLGGAVKARLAEKGSLRVESWGSEALKSSLTALTQVAGMSEAEGGPGIWFHPFFQEVNRSGDGENSTMHVVVMDVLQVPEEGA